MMVPRGGIEPATQGFSILVIGDWKVAPNNFVHAIQEIPIKLR